MWQLFATHTSSHVPFPSHSAEDLESDIYHSISTKAGGPSLLGGALLILF
jgi:hypothetical protein